MLSQRAALAILLTPFAVLAFDWSLRAPDARETGLAPAAFVTGCICLVVVLRISAGVPTLVAVAAWLVAAAWWWIAGEDALVSLWAAFAYLLLVPGVPASFALIAAILIRPSWTLVRVLAWLCAVVMVPGFVAVVEFAG